MDIESLSLFYSAVLGLIVGSFTNVLIHRLPLKVSPVKPSSSCPKCKTKIHWYDNIPVLSFLFLLGKCRGCSAPISWRYPLVELIMMGLFVACFYHDGWGPVLWFRDWPLMMIFVAVFFIDLKHRIIPDVLSLGGLLVGLATTWMVPEIGWKGSLTGAGVGFGIFFGFSWIYYQLTRKVGLGGGDIKFLAMLGAFLGISGVLSTVVMSSISGSLIGILWILLVQRKKKDIMKAAIPYGPFLVIGGLISFFDQDLLWHLFMIRT